MEKPKWKYDKVTRQHVGTEMANPDYVRWADERIAALEAAEVAPSASANKPSAFASQIAAAERGIVALRGGEDKMASSIFDDIVRQLRTW
jgi:hypothetical protein